MHAFLLFIEPANLSSISHVLYFLMYYGQMDISDVDSFFKEFKV